MPARSAPPKAFGPILEVLAALSDIGISLSPSTFRKLVTRGTLPAPIPLTSGKRGKRLWNIDSVKQAIVRLGEGQSA